MRCSRRAGRGRLKGQGPDGKLIVRVREEGERWMLEHVLVTLQQRPETAFLELCIGIAGTLEEAYRRIRRADRRWCAPWEEVELMLNPNGPLLNGGSDGDNGQTGRKLVMDYYGPRVPIGGGALYGQGSDAHRSGGGEAGAGDGVAGGRGGGGGVPGAADLCAGGE